MPLHYSSLLLSLGFAGTCLAIVLFATWSSARTEKFLFTWALGCTLVVFSVFIYSSYAYGSHAGSHGEATVVAAFLFLILGFVTVYAAAVQFRVGHIPTRRMAAVSGAALVVGLGAFATPYDGLGFILTNVVAALLMFATAREYFLARAEAPGATLGLFALYGMVGVSFALCAMVLIADGAVVLGHAPSNWAEELNLVVSIAALAGVGALSLALNQARLARSHLREARTDVLTGLLNRRALFDTFTERDLPAFTCVVVFDLDDFKAVNDSHGHAVGDEVLRRFAEIVRTEIRGIDTAARLGGEEFAIVLPRADAQSAIWVAERIRSAFADVAVATPDGPVRCTVSAGVAAAAPGGEAFTEVLQRADEALYVAKRNGRDRVVAEPLRLAS
jgi:diguanylate cyclase (GGDEF)-like protein